MAAGLLRRSAEVRMPGFRVDSAGLSALVGQPADPTAVRLLAERGIDISAHRAKQVTEGLLRSHALILAMERRQQDSVKAAWPALRGRVFRWGEWQGFDIPDPYGRDERAFRDSLAALDRGLAEWLPKLGIALA